MENTTNFKSFNYLENGEVSFSILDTIRTTKTLESKSYHLKTEGETYNNSLKTVLKILKTDDNLEPVQYRNKDEVEEIYVKFFDGTIRKICKQLNYNHKCGILLHGSQGTGKTTIIKDFCNRAIKDHDAIVFSFFDYEKLDKSWDFIRKIRNIQDNPIIIFLDELDEAFNKQNNIENTLKIIMDGQLSIDNCFFFAATNYIDKIPKTIRNRPSRFKYSIDIGGVDSEETVRKFLNDSFNKVGLTIDFEKDISRLTGKTIDDLKEYVINKGANIESKIETKKLGF